MARGELFSKNVYKMRGIAKGGEPEGLDHSRRHYFFSSAFISRSDKMALEDFEKALAEERERESRPERSSGEKHRHRHHDRDRDRDRGHRRDRDRSRDHRHRHRSHRHRSRSREENSDRNGESRREDSHRHKRSRRSSDHGDDQEPHKRRHREGKDEDQSAPAAEIAQEEPARPKRDAWMEAPSSLDIDYVQRREKTRLEEEPKPRMLQADFELKIHNRELNNHLRDLKDGKALDEIEQEPAEHEVNYMFGDAGSGWRMTKLKNVYREAKESGRSEEEIAMERFGDLRSFDDAREEEAELDRRETYGEGYVGKEKPSGELFRERKQEEKVHRDPHEHIRDPEQELSAQGQGKPMETDPPQQTTQHLDLTALNKLKAQMMRAKLKGASDAAELEEQYNAAAAGMANQKEPDVMVLGVKDNRMLAGKRNEVKAVETKRGLERGKVEENQDMTIEDMVQEERRTRGQFGGEGRRLAERIAKDGKFEVCSI